MAGVVATSKGYWGGAIREIGDVFSMPDAEARIMPWVKPDPATAFGGKGDHDGDGHVGGSLPKNNNDQAEPKKRGRKTKVDEPEPFGDAPEPMTVAEALKDVGGIRPDWVAPDGQPVAMVDD